MQPVNLFGSRNSRSLNNKEKKEEERKAKRKVKKKPEGKDKKNKGKRLKKQLNTKDKTVRQHRPRQSKKVQKGSKKNKSQKVGKARTDKKKGRKGRNNSIKKIGCINKKNFVVAFRKGKTKEEKKKNSNKSLLKAFKEIDTNHDNCISPKENRKMKKTLKSKGSRQGRTIGISLGMSLELLGMATNALRGLYQQNRGVTINRSSFGFPSMQPGRNIHQSHVAHCVTCNTRVTNVHGIPGVFETSP